MKERYIVLLIFLLLPSLNISAQTWPDEESPIVKIERTQGRSNLIVPKSFEGRTGKEEYEAMTLKIADRALFTRTNIKTRLQGRTNRFDFDVKSDHIRGMVWESDKKFPRRTMCMDCHGTDISQARTQIWIGEESRELQPKPIKQGNAIIQFPDASVNKGYLEIKHWVSPHQAINGGISRGKLTSFKTIKKAESVWLGWGWHDRKNIELASEIRSTKAESYSYKHEFISKLTFRNKKGFSFTMQGGILLNGFAQYDAGFSDVGTVVLSTEKNAPEDLPNIYTRLKNDRFGYYTIKARYEYAF